MCTDLHQHVWTPQLVEALAARRRLPLIDRAGGLDVLHADSERPYIVDPDANSPEARTNLADQDRLQQVVVALSSPIGIETLPRTEAVELIDAHLAGLQDLPSEFLAWGPIALDELDITDVDAVLARGCVGVSLPAPALAGPARLDAIGPLLERIERAGAPLFVHPGRAVTQSPREAPLDEPVWWQAMTGYVGQMQAAWLSFAAYGRRMHPELKVVFAMLAGCGPLQAERFEQRGGPQLELHDPLSFYDTSSYGPRAIETVARLAGAGQLVYGSDRPVVEPKLNGREAVLQRQAGELLSGARRPVPA